MSDYVPPLQNPVPPAPVKKSNKGVIWAIVIVGVLILAAIGAASDDSTPTSTGGGSSVTTVTNDTGSSEAELESIADVTWAAQSTEQQLGFCQGIDLFGYDKAAELMNQGADYTFSSDEARYIVEYIDQTYC